jgi:predicted O-methyltransferase YrrM
LEDKSVKIRILPKLRFGRKSADSFRRHAPAAERVGLERADSHRNQQSLRLQGPVDSASQPIRPTDAQLSTGQVVASCGEIQDQAAVNNIRPLNGFNYVYTAPAELRMPERVALYSLVFGLQPENCLEIGTFRGGSSAIICGAMDDTGFGQLACVDPSPRIAPELWSRISHRCRMFKGLSPDILPEVARQVGVPFDFAFIDGNHTYDCLRRDITGVLPHLADKAYLLFHDGHYPDVEQAIGEAIDAYRELTDCGLLSVEPTVLQQNGRSVSYAGLHLLRFRRSTVN